MHDIDGSKRAPWMWPPSGSNSFHFHAIFWEKLAKIAPLFFLVGALSHSTDSV